MPSNTRVILAKRPVGDSDAACFRVAQVDVPALGENAPALFRGRLKGRNFGKQLVKVAEEQL